jgi:hypothetical protein
MGPGFRQDEGELGFEPTFARGTTKPVGKYCRETRLLVAYLGGPF